MRINQKCARSSMDRITDSGSVDWGSTPHGHTERLPSRFSYTPAHQQITSYYLEFKHTTQIHEWKFISAYIREIPLNTDQAGKTGLPDSTISKRVYMEIMCISMQQKK